MQRDRALGEDQAAFGVLGQQVGVVHIARGAVRAHADGGDQVEAQARQVEQVVVGERLVAKVRVHEAQRAEASAGGAEAADVGEGQARGVADDDVLDGAAAVDQHADLAAGGEGGVEEGARELGREDPIGGDAAAEDALDGAGVARRKTVGVAEDLIGTPPFVSCVRGRR